MNDGINPDELNTALHNGRSSYSHGITVWSRSTDGQIRR